MTMASDKKEITKQDWRNILATMQLNNLYDGFVDFTREGVFRFFETDPRINGVHAIPVTMTMVEKYAE